MYSGLKLTGMCEGCFLVGIFDCRIFLGRLKNILASIFLGCLSEFSRESFSDTQNNITTRGKELLPCVVPAL